MSAPMYDELWDYNQPDVTEKRFRELLADMPGDPADARLQLLTQIARAQGVRHHFDAAHATLDQVSPSLDETTPVVRIRYLLERGRVFNSSGQPEMARPLFEGALDVARQSGEDFYAVDAAHMIAIVAPPDEQIAWNERAIAMAEASESPFARRWLGSLYNNLGWTYHDMGKYDEALDLFQRGVDFWTERDNPDRLHIARWTVARVYRSMGRHDEALEILRDLKSGEDGYVSEEIGENLMAQGDADSASRYFSRAYQLLSKDEWLQANEPKRLDRLWTLSQEQ